MASWGWSISYVVSISVAPARTYQIYIVHEGSMASWCWSSNVVSISLAPAKNYQICVPVYLAAATRKIPRASAIYSEGNLINQGYWISVYEFQSRWQMIEKQFNKTTYRRKFAWVCCCLALIQAKAFVFLMSKHGGWWIGFSFQIFKIYRFRENIITTDRRITMLNITTCHYLD